MKKNSELKQAVKRLKLPDEMTKKELKAYHSSFRGEPGGIRPSAVFKDKKHPNRMARKAELRRMERYE